LNPDLGWLAKRAKARAISGPHRPSRLLFSRSFFAPFSRVSRAAYGVRRTSRLFSETLSASCTGMWKCLLLGSALVTGALAQNPGGVELANLREDVRGLSQRVGELALRVEQLERENGELRQRASAANASYATLNQLNTGLADLERSLKRAIAATKDETLEHVGTQMAKLARDTNTALDSLAKASAPRSSATVTTTTAPAAPAFSDNFPKEGVQYTVQKGDFLAAIAKKTGAKAQDIINANKLSDPDRLVVGQNLFIPGGK
jgi:LysM repeat protein